MNGPTRILHLEDSAEDAELIAALLEEEGLVSGLHLVTTLPAFRKALEQPWDLILADYALPGIRNRQALEVAIECCPEVPFIYVSGTLGETTAIECLHHGASDYVLKEGLNRLVPAVHRTLAEAAERRARRLAEASLVASEANYRRIVETSNEGIWIVDAESRTTFANPRMAEMLAVLPEELLGASLWRFVDPRDRPALEAKLDRRHQGAAGVYEIRFLRTDGTEVWTLLATTPLFSGKGRYSGTMAMATDISSLKASESERDRLEAEERELLAATLAAGVIPWSQETRDGSFLMGAGSASVVGWPPDHFRVPGFDLASMAFPEDRPAFLLALDKAGAGEICTLDLRVLDSTGRRLWTRWTLSTRGGRLHGTVRDVNEPHHLLDMLVQSQKLESMGAVAGGVAHDVNNLLTVFFAHLGMIQLEGLVTEELARHIKPMSHAADQVKALVGELLSFARKKEPRREATDLNKLVLASQDLLGVVLGAQVSLGTALEPGLPALLLDGGQIHQVLMNLVINARDAMTGGGTLQIATRTNPGCVILEVSDTGKGIPQEVISRIFEPFFTTKEEGKGTGLGLAVVYGIVTAHGGTIHCTSTPGEGTRFQLTFPTLL